MTVCLLVITDGRLEYLDKAVASALDNLEGNIVERVMYDDTGDPNHRAMLRADYPEFDIIHACTRQGFAGAIRAAWRHLRTNSTAAFVFHAEQDFTYNRPVPLTEIADVLDANPHLVQLALRRQPWNDDERAAGGIVEQHPDDFVEVDGRWLEHRRFFTTNPSLYRRLLLVEHDWPMGANSEGVFTHRLLEDPTIRFGYWGPRDSGEAVTHIGAHRVGSGY